MGRILEELYSGDLQPAENRNWDDPEYEVKCEASLEEVRWLPAGHTVGSEQPVTLRRPTRVGVLPVGYQNGFGVARVRDPGFWAAIRYLQKNMQAEADGLKGEKGYLASKGLNRSKVYRSWVEGEREAVRQIEASLKGAEPLYKYQTSHQYEDGASDELFIQDVTATYKYYAYKQDNSDQFPKLPTAKKRRRL